MNNTGPFYRIKHNVNFYNNVTLISIIFIYLALIGNILYNQNYQLVINLLLNTFVTGLIIYIIDVVMTKIIVKSNWKDTLINGFDKLLIINTLVINAVLLNPNLIYVAGGVAIASIIVNLVNQIWLKDGLNISVISILIISIINNESLLINNFYLVALASVILIISVGLDVVKKRLFNSYLLILIVSSITLYLLSISLISVFNVRFLIILLFILLNNMITPVTIKSSIINSTLILTGLLVAVVLSLPINYYLIIIMTITTIVGLLKNKLDLI